MLDAAAVYTFFVFSTVFGQFTGVHDTLEACEAQRLEISGRIAERANEVGLVSLDRACRRVSLSLPQGLAADDESAVWPSLAAPEAP